MTKKYIDWHLVYPHDWAVGDEFVPPDPDVPFPFVGGDIDFGYNGLNHLLVSANLPPLLPYGFTPCVMVSDRPPVTISSAD